MIQIDLLDAIQIVLLLAACYACYWKGVHNGIVSFHDHLVEQGLIKDMTEED